MLEQLEKMAIAKAEESFVESFFNKMSNEQKIEEGLGLLLAKWAEWDGNKLARVFYWALEDANFHHEAGQISEMFNLGI